MECLTYRYPNQRPFGLGNDFLVDCDEATGPQRFKKDPNSSESSESSEDESSGAGYFLGWGIEVHLSQTCQLSWPRFIEVS